MKLAENSTPRPDRYPLCHVGAVDGVYRRLAAFELPASGLSRRRSLAASDSSQSRKVAIFGSDAVVFGQTIQYVFDSGKDSGKARPSRQLIRSQAAKVVRARAIPCPLIAASI